ncbi:MAG: hypothetical protein KJO44_03385 [Gemmatimonadetes bacterium]|nr:hypothetical protein [Gemmatimonadota bacterium]
MITRSLLGLFAAPVLGLTGCSSGVAESNATPEDPVCDLPVVAGYLPAQLFEASGIARDPRRSDLFWVHNDSDNDPALYAVDTTGALAGEAAIIGATNRDVEDVAVARCTEGWCLFYADMGDNLSVRDQVYVHRLPLPDLPSGATVPLEAVSPFASYTMVFPGGPRDAESLFVDSERGELGVVTKGRNGQVELYVADLQTLESVDGPVALERIGRLDVPIGGNLSAQYVTAADLSPDGQRLGVRSYTWLYVFEWAGSSAFDTLAAPANAALFPAAEPQGEGLAFSNDGLRFFLASEGQGARPPQLSRIDCLP